MAVVDSVIKRLATLARRVMASDADLRPAAGVLADAVRLAAWGNGTELRSTQPALAALHTALAGNAGWSLSTRLSDDRGREFVDGAVWAISEIYTARLNMMDSVASAPARKSRKAELETTVLQLLRVDLPQTPGQLQRGARQQGITMKPYEISRALGELLARDLVRNVDPPEDSDRRNRYFVLTDEGNMRVRGQLTPVASPPRTDPPGRSGNAGTTRF